ncbi:hypothetical protein ADIS_1639 [Lunatimonas lonarensis]|uniref:Alginate lyase domain-containing protein n=1 Tax=Lunatimonas lonarensis TaxID=1232681 RepID=R7ZUV3_9BACT|nr:alginate lyase family protein [Lunatimonas lonarensis]EON77926.1 hypothetical protein ADIS_1639 [Lunatimonas lonarensis]
MWALLIASLLGGFDLSSVSTDAWTTLFYVDSQQVKRADISEETLAVLRRDFEAIKGTAPNPTPTIFYEGLLNNDPRRVKTEEHLRDMDRLSLLYWFHILQDTQDALPLMMELALSWVYTYVPDGNPINENKLVPLVYVYPLVRLHLSSQEREAYRNFLVQLALGVRDFPKAPMNNWETKRIHLLGVIGLVLERPDFTAWAEERFKNYVDQSLYADGSSSDIRQRDALSYHVSALKPLCQYLGYVEALYPGKGSQLFGYTGETGGSLYRSLQYVLPYAKKEAVYAQWSQTTVALDKQRAEAGLAEYQPGVEYQAERAYDTMAMASLFDAVFVLGDCGHIICQLVRPNDSD